MDGERNVVLVRKSAQRRRRAGRNDLRQCDGKQSQPADVPLRGASVEQVADSLAGAQPTDRSKPNNDPIADSCQACAGIQLSMAITRGLSSERNPLVNATRSNAGCKGRTAIGFTSRPEQDATADRVSIAKWAQRDLNPRPSDYESAALTT